MTGPWWQQLLRPDVNPSVENGIWRLHPQADDRFFAEYLPDAFLHALLERARAVDWKQAVEEGLPSLRPDLATYTRDYLLAPYRADFVDSLGLDRESVVLDLGCGWGFASQRCLDLGAHVIGTDAALGRLEFCALRFSQQGLGTSFLGIEMDANRPFPFAPETFDTVIVSGLMEWLPSTADGSPDAIQQAFLQQCSTALRPGGRLYLAIENRWWWKYFVGARDLHRVHRLQVLTSILPRGLANVWSRVLTGHEYRTYTHSFFDYARLLRDAGFTQLDVTYPDPDYVQPRTTQPLIRQVTLSLADTELRTAINAQHPAWFLRAFGRSFMFTATK